MLTLDRKSENFYYDSRAKKEIGYAAKESEYDENTQENLKRLIKEEIIECIKGEKLFLLSYEDNFLSVDRILNQKKRAGKKSLRQEFNKLYSYWKEDTASFSSISKKVKHPAYVKIIEMGHDAIPLILKSLLSEPDHWFVALNKIANENPIPYGATFEESVIGWLQWGNKRGLI